MSIISAGDWWCGHLYVVCWGSVSYRFQLNNSFICVINWVRYWSLSSYEVSAFRIDGGVQVATHNNWFVFWILEGFGRNDGFEVVTLRCLRDWWAMVSLTTSIGESLVYPQMAREGALQWVTRWASARTSVDGFREAFDTLVLMVWRRVFLLWISLIPQEWLFGCLG